MNKIFIVTGEASGDLVAAWFVQHKLERVIPGAAYLEAVGGDALTACGVTLHSSFKQLNVVGLVEILKRLPNILRIMRQLADHIVEQRFSHVVLVDFPGFNMRLGALLKARNPTLKIIYLAPPQLWCWGQWRLKRLKKIADELIVLFPFEVVWYRQYGVAVRYLGNPVVDRVLPAVRQLSRPRFRLGVFPGSRVQEVESFVPLLRGTLSLLLEKFPHLEVAIFQAPHIELSQVESLIQIAPDRTVVVKTEDRLRAMQSCAVALAKAGTVTLELGLFRIPTVIFYKAHWLTYALAKKLVSIDRMGLPNIIAQQDLMPEFIQRDCTPKKLSTAVANVLLLYQEDLVAYTKKRENLLFLEQLFAQTS